MNPNTMNLDECRDWLAKEAGWTFRSAVGNHWWEQSEGDPGTATHPIPATLDEAAKLPEGWWFWVNYSGTTEFATADKPFRERYVCEAVTKQTAERVRSEASTELLARFRLRVACVMHEKGIK